MSTLKHEQRILAALIDNLAAAGYQVAAIWTEQDYVMPIQEGLGGDFQPEVTEIARDDAPDTIQRPMTKAEVLQAFADYDLYAPTVHFTEQHKTTWANHGVMVVPGNGSDFISDWHCGDKAFDAIVSAVGEAAGDEVYS